MEIQTEPSKVKKQEILELIDVISRNIDEPTELAAALSALIEIAEGKPAKLVPFPLGTIGCINNTIKVAAGHYVDLANPDPRTIEIKSIASALSKICRFGGHCPRFYSVAEHCIHATNLAIQDGVPNEVLGDIFLHDSAEAYIGDMVKPLKVMLPEYGETEWRMEMAIECAMGVSFVNHSKTIKHYDRLMLKAEKLAMWPEDTEVWSGFGGIDARHVDFKFWGPDEAEMQFLAMARTLLLNGA